MCLNGYDIKRGSLPVYRRCYEGDGSCVGSMFEESL